MHHSRRLVLDHHVRQVRLAVTGHIDDTSSVVKRTVVTCAGAGEHLDVLDRLAHRVPEDSQLHVIDG